MAIQKRLKIIEALHSQIRHTEPKALKGTKLVRIIHLKLDQMKAHRTVGMDQIKDIWCAHVLLIIFQRDRI